MKSKASRAKIAVYAGTFDPITNGHLDVASRAARMFESVVLAVASGAPKEPLFPAADRVQLAQKAVSDIEGDLRVIAFDGLLVDFVKQIGGSVIIRGLRAVSDYEYEAQMALFNRQLAEDIETVFLMTSDKYSFITSSIIKQVAMFGGDVSRFVPPHVVTCLTEVYQKK